MKTLETMTKDEKSLLLFFESRATDNAGKVDLRHMNQQDIEIAKKWDKEGFCGFGRVASEGVNQYGSHWCQLSDTAWHLAHQARKAKAIRTWDKRSWKTTEEKRDNKI